MQDCLPVEDRLREAVAARLPEAVSLLERLVRIPSLSGQERQALDCLAGALEGGPWAVEQRPIPPGIRDDPDYAGRELGLDYAGRHNLAAVLQGGEGGRSALIQTHLDVVPAGDWAEAFAPRIEDGILYGRGACDCKGQVATLWLALAALRDAGVRLRGRLTAQFVVEEEIGGNGALAEVLRGDRADAAVVLEPTSLRVHPACRGALWFRLTVRGLSVHMGRKQEGVSALEKALKVLAALNEYEERLVEESRGQPLFARYAHPVQVNVGMVRAGDWPSMVPGECVVEGGVGFLPGKTLRQVEDELRGLIAACHDDWLAEHACFQFPRLRNDAYAIDPGHPAVRALADACAASGIHPDVCGWNVSCDARLYALRGGMPAVVFGPGDVAHAHSAREQIAIQDMARAAEALARFAIRWCGAGARP